MRATLGDIVFAVLMNLHLREQQVLPVRGWQDNKDCLPTPVNLLFSSLKALSFDLIGTGG